MRFWWSLPGETNAYRLVDSPSDNREELDFEIVPFDGKDSSALRFHGFRERMDEQFKHDSLSLKLKRESYDTYRRALDEAIAKCREGEFEKVVVARQIHLEGELDCNSLFHKLVGRYPNCFVYLFDHGNKTYLGASPEELLLVEGQLCRSASLAGTLPAVKGADIENWRDKEKAEQRYVTDYITRIYGQFCSEVEVSETQVKLNGPVCHLYNEVKGRLKPEVNVHDLLNELHPTPAVCGIPFQNTKSWIQESEGWNRNFYTGYLAMSKSDQLMAFVNLRCLKYSSGTSSIFVGGGITADSILEEEFEETRQKSRVLLDVIKEIQEVSE